MGRYVKECIAFTNTIVDAVNVLIKTGSKYAKLPTIDELNKLADGIEKHQPQDVIADILLDDDYANYKKLYLKYFNGVLDIKITLGEVRSADGNAYNYWGGLERKLQQSQMSDDEIDSYVIKLGELTSLIENSIMAMKQDLDYLFAEGADDVPAEEHV